MKKPFLRLIISLILLIGRTAPLILSGKPKAGIICGLAERRHLNPAPRSKVGAVAGRAGNFGSLEGLLQQPTPCRSNCSAVRRMPTSSGLARVVTNVAAGAGREDLTGARSLGRIDPLRPRVRRADQRGQSVGAAWRTFAGSRSLSGLNRPPADPGVPDRDVDATQPDRGWPW
jgi:hypothetical protein